MRTPGIRDDGFKHLPPSAGNKFNIENVTPPKDGWKDLEINQEGDVLTVHVTGGNKLRINDAKRESVQLELEYLVDKINNPVTLRFEMSNLDYLSSKAWGMLINATKNLDKKDSRLELVNITPEMYESITLEDTKDLLNWLNIIDPPSI